MSEQRLIDANELKKATEKYTDCANIDCINCFRKLIDNAPTVSERPKGEWIECTKSGMPLTEYGRMTGEKWYGFKCSRCNFIYKGNALIESPFCQKCGADMKGTEK